MFPKICDIYAVLELFDAHKQNVCIKAKFGYVSAYYLILQSTNSDVH